MQELHMTVRRSVCDTTAPLQLQLRLLVLYNVMPFHTFNMATVTVGVETIKRYARAAYDCTTPCLWHNSTATAAVAASGAV